MILADVIKSKTLLLEITDLEVVACMLK